MVQALTLLVIMALFLGVVVWVVVVPIILLVRTSRLSDLSARLGRVERWLERLKGEQAENAADNPIPPREVPALAGALETPTPMPPFARAAAPPRRPPDEPAAPVAGSVAIDLETWIGRRGLGWVAVILLLFAVAFFLKYAFENGWVGPLGRVGIGILVGAALCLAGYRYHCKHLPIFSQMLTSAGVVLLYLATYAAFGYYELLPRHSAEIFLILIVAEAAGLALLYDAPAIAIMAVIGGLLNPVLLHSGHDPYRSLFVYLVVLDLGVVGLVLLRSWPALGSIALVGTHLLFDLWYYEHYHRAKLTAALLFQVGVFGVFLMPSLFAGLRRRSVDIEALGRLVLNAFLFTVILYGLLNDDYHQWMGTIAVGLAIIYGALAWLLSSWYPEDRRHLFVVVAVALGLVATIFPWQANAAWVAVGWAVEGTALWWFGLRIGTKPLRLLGAVLLVLAVGRLVFIDTPAAHPEPFTPIFNSYGLPAFVILACVFVVTAISRTSPAVGQPLDRVGMWAAGISGVLLGWLIVSLEAYDYFTVQVQQAAAIHDKVVDAAGRPVLESMHVQAQELRRAAWMSLSLIWAAYAGIVLAAGFLRHNQPLRWTALGLFGVTLCKVILSDMDRLPGLYRIAAFFFLAVILGTFARIYQRFQQPPVALVGRK